MFRAAGTATMMPPPPGKNFPQPRAREAGICWCSRSDDQEDGSCQSAAEPLGQLFGHTEPCRKGELLSSLPACRARGPPMRSGWGNECHLVVPQLPSTGLLQHRAVKNGTYRGSLAKSIKIHFPNPGSRGRWEMSLKLLSLLKVFLQDLAEMIPLSAVLTKF